MLEHGEMANAIVDAVAAEPLTRRHGDPEENKNLVLVNQEITGSIIGAAVEVHKVLGPGLLENAYEECLCHELHLRGIAFKRQIPVPVSYKGVKVDCGYRVDLLVSDKVVVELKSVEKLLPVHEAQLLTYLRATGKKVGLLINFNVPVLHRGIIRRVL
jgi:GxxExxY protein